MAEQEASFTGQQGAAARPGVTAPQDGSAAQQPATGNGADSSRAAANGNGGPPAAAPLDPARRRVMGIVVGILVVIGLIWGARYWAYSQNHVSTDDAYVTGNLVNVSPIISGTLTKLTVDEGDQVRAGTVIAELDQSGPKAALDQAEAAYLAAASQVPQAQINLSFEQATTQAAIEKARASLAEQNAKTAGAQQQAQVTASTVTSQTEQAVQQEAAAAAQAAQADAQAGSAAAALASARQGIETAQHAADASTDNIASAKANAQNASWNLARYQELRAKDAVTQQQLNAQQAQSDTAAAQLEQAGSQAAQTQSQVAQAQAAANQAAAQLAAMRRAAAAAHKLVAVAAEQVQIAQANEGQAGIQKANYQSNQGSTSAAAADLNTALAGTQEIALRRSMVQTTKAEADQAKAAYANAQVTFDDTVIRAPMDGQVVRKAVNVGAALSPGQTIVTMTYGNGVWIEANYKETQLTDVRPGETAEVQVDAYPKKTFLGTVESINAATGASTALLPPDNATGNFTKVVQRVPVKIVLRPARSGEDTSTYATADDIANLRQGMSVTAVIDTKSGKQQSQ